MVYDLSKVQDEHKSKTKGEKIMGNPDSFSIAGGILLAFSIICLSSWFSVNWEWLLTSFFEMFYNPAKHPLRLICFTTPAIIMIFWIWLENKRT